jgi:hypothetical protein
MNSRFRTMVIASAAVAMVAVATLSLRAARTPAQSASAVRVETIPPAQQAIVPPGQKGATYYWLESQTKKLTTRFAEATATAERDVYGKLSTTLRDTSGNEIGHFQVNRADGVHDTLRYIDAAGAVLQAVGDPSVRPTLDWSNQQIYHLWKDKIDPGYSVLEWQNGMMRLRGAPARDAEREIVELEAEWADSLTAKTVRRVASHHEAVKGRFVDGDALVTRLVGAAGAEIGASYWYARPQLFVWNIPALHTGGFIGPEHLHAQFGGWPFTPDMAWMNLQTLAFHHFKGLINQRRFVARTELPKNRILQFFAPILTANETGCDDLHWLDNSVFRYCCDVHDLCYEKAGCNASSWWKVWTSWTCDFCNADVIHCFLTGGIGSGGPGKLA